jgi:hypothetical protein
LVASTRYLASLAADRMDPKSFPALGVDERDAAAQRCGVRPGVEPDGTITVEADRTPAHDRE